MTVPFQHSPYLREQRQFPFSDLRMLANQMDQSYIDIASKVNARTVGTFATNFQIVTGNRWFLEGEPRPQQTLRQVYFDDSGTITSPGTTIAHGIDFTSVSLFTPLCYGSYTDGTNFYGAIYGSSTPIPGQVSFYVTPTNIVILVDAAAPTITSLAIVLEWVSVF